MDLKREPILNDEELYQDMPNSQIKGQTSIEPINSSKKMVSFDQINNSEVIELSKQIGVSEPRNNRTKGVTFIMLASI